jgi:hypothetical protein
MTFKRIARISVIALSLSIFVPVSLPITQAHAENCGWAMVDADGKSGGVSVGDCAGNFWREWQSLGLLEGVFKNAGCKLPCSFVIQTREDPVNKNVAGYSTDFSNQQPGQTQVTYDNNSNTFTVGNSSKFTLVIKDGVATDSSGNSFVAGTGVPTTTNLSVEQYKNLVTESNRINQAGSQRLIALNKSKELALQTPGVERCVTWQGYLENGTECSKAVISTIASGETSTVTSVSVKNTITESSKNILKSDTSTAGVDSVTVTVKATNGFETSTTTVDSVDFEGKSKDIVLLSQKLESSKVTISGIQKALIKFDAIKSKTTAKQVILPDAKQVNEEAVSESPAICKIKGITVVRLKKGTCEVSYSLTSLDTGNTYTAVKSLSFK